MSRIDIILKEEERTKTIEPEVNLEEMEKRKTRRGLDLEMER